jgi:hypothetical protein
MKKLTSFIHESNKQDFTKKVAIILDNNVVLEAKINVKDLNESFANTQILESLLNKSIKNVTIVTESEEMSDSTIINNSNPEKETVEYYVPWTSVFDTAPYYQADKIANAIKDDEDVISTYEENAFGWSNQPKVVIAKIESENIKATVERLKSKIQNALGTEWIHMSEKDW